MIGEWEVPRIERIGTVEGRRLARLSVPGLVGDLHHDLGRHSLAVEIVGSLHGDTERDAFLEAVREPFNAGEPLPFVADILTATELEQVLIEGLELPGLLGDVPAIGDPTPPLREALDGVKAATAPLSDALASLGEAFS
jgi:hypothetical protein